MASPSAATLLDAWERGLSRSSVERPVTLLQASGPTSGGELARLPVGERDVRLLELRAAAFGPRLEGAVTCPGCGESLELSLAVDDLRAVRNDARAEALTIEADDYEVRFRLPDTEDLSAIAASEDPESARRRLFERCVVEVHHQGERTEARRVPDHVVTAVSEAMDRADPQAGIEVDLVCPACEHAWQSPFDIASFLWTETDTWARRTLGQVDALASAYGWSEAEILGLSARRRQAYLDLIGG